MDGVIWRNQQPIGDLSNIFGVLIDKNIKYCFATNNSSRTVDSYQKKLQELGVHVTREQIFTSAKSTAEMLASQHPQGGNVFVVGDVKQSIYAWRGAKPEIFLERLKTASIDLANASVGLRVDLNANFRSAKGLLDFVNKIFGRIMTTSFAKIDYDESAELRPAFEDESKRGGVGDKKDVVEFHILDEGITDSGRQTADSEEQNASLNPVRNSTTGNVIQKGKIFNVATI